LLTARAAFGSGLAEVVTRVLAVVLAIVTARTLEPREVGLLGLAVIVIGLISMIGYYPETAAVAARGESNDNSHALAAMMVRSVLVAALIGLLVVTFPVVANYLIGGPNGTTEFRHLMLVLLWAPILECLSGYPQVILQRRLDLRFLACVQIIQAVVFVGLATILLVQGKGYVAVAWASLIGTAAAFLALWSRTLRRGWFRFERWPAGGLWRETLIGSSRVFLGGFGGYLGARLDNLLVAGAMGPAIMSYYSTAWTASRTPTGILSRAINSVLVPTFARIQDDTRRIDRGIRECLYYSYMVLAPTCAVLFVCAPDLVVTILGPKWTPVIPALRLMSVTVLVGPLLDASNALLIGTGRAHLSGVSAVVRIVALLLLIQPLVHRWSVVGAAWGDLLSALASTIALFVIARAVERDIKWPVLSALVIPVVAGLLSGIPAWIGGGYLAPGLARLAFEICILSVSYPLLVAAIGGRRRLMDLAALLRGVFLSRIATAGSRG
jgi:O-antigen/teichoic acid export membrane protein